MGEVKDYRKMGVLVFEGMKVGVLPGDFSFHVNEHGDPQSTFILSTSYNVLPIFLRIAHDNFVMSHHASMDIKTKWNDDPKNQKSLLIKELTSSIQVFIASGIALDSLYDQLKPHAKITQSDIDMWRTRRTKRSSQIVQVIKRVYKLDNETSLAFGKNIKSIIDLRDQAVHPDNSLKQSRPRSDIPVGVDWRFAAYRYDNAAICYRILMNMLIYLYGKKSSNSQVDSEMDSIFKTLIEMGLVSRNSQQDSAPEPLTQSGDF